jgi:hypothetical protein
MLEFFIIKQIYIETLWQFKNNLESTKSEIVK